MQEAKDWLNALSAMDMEKKPEAREINNPLSL